MFTVFIYNMKATALCSTTKQLLTVKITNKRAFKIPFTCNAPVALNIQWPTQCCDRCHSREEEEGDMPRPRRS